MRRLAVPLALLAMGAAIVFLLGDFHCDAPPAPDAAPPRPAPVDAAVAPVMPDAGPRDAEADAAPLTLERVAAVGMLGLPETWLDPLFAHAGDHWRRDPEAVEPTFVNGNGTRLSFWLKQGRVVGAGATFQGAGAASAEVTALSSFLVGNQHPLPIHVEGFESPDEVKPQGSFEVDGRLLYYRARLAREGPPYPPAEFQISVVPFPGQPAGLDPPPAPEEMHRADPSLPAPPPHFHD